MSYLFLNQFNLYDRIKIYSDFFDTQLHQISLYVYLHKLKILDWLYK